MRKLAKPIGLFLLLVLASAGSALAQQLNSSYKVAVIDSARAFENSMDGKRAISQLQEKEASIKAVLKKYDDNLRALESRINTGRFTLTSEAMLNLQRDYDSKTTERKRYEEDATKEFNVFMSNLRQRIQDEMTSVITSLAKEKGFDLVFERQSAGLVYFSLALDITDEVVRRYDATKTPTPPVKK